MQIGSDQIGDGKSEHWHFKNQWNKMSRMGEFNSDDRYINYCGQESLRRNGVAKKWQKDLCFHSKPFNITVIQVYTSTTNAEEMEDEWFYEDL